MIPDILLQLLANILLRYSIKEAESVIQESCFKIGITEEEVSPQYSNYRFYCWILLSREDTKKIFINSKKLIKDLKKEFSVERIIYEEVENGRFLISVILKQSVSEE